MNITRVFITQWCVLLIALASLGFSVNLKAKEARIYSTEGYCILAFEQVESDYLAEYEKKLGFRPKLKLCNRVNRLVSEFQPASWNYKFGQPYPGSSIYLNPEQVAKIEQAREKHRQARR
jgi:hypothetical protein|tara:strand:+ start:336 stop:695 length:360 start_codon:yes stop_codon:yes gene_type:complete